MQNNVTIRRIVAVWVTICTIVSSFCMVVTAEETTGTNSSGSLVFSGFTLTYGANNQIQGFVDVSTENIDATGVAILLEYDSRYLVPSNYKTNEPATDASETFDQNTAVFNKTTDVDGNVVTNYLSFLDSEISGSEMLLNLVPDESTPTSEYIGEKTLGGGSTVEKTLKCVKAEGRSVSWGRISFQIVDPLQVCNMDAAALQNILKVSEANLIYIKDDRIEYFDANLPTDWKVNRTLDSVEPTVKQRTVSSYSIYNRCRDNDKSGTQADLIAYLNQTMGNVVMRYTDGQQTLGRIVWDDSDPTFNVSYSTGTGYNPLGGVTYTISQAYGGTGKTVEVKVTVTPVTITGFIYNNRVITYRHSSRPKVWDDLLMPETITPVLNGIDDMYIPPSDNPVQTNWSPDDVTEALTSSPAPVSETYTHEYTDSTGTLVGQPWLTVPDGFDWNVYVYRNVVDDSTPMPDPDHDRITAEVERVSGNLVITVSTIGGDSIASGTEFNIYLPNGMVIKSIDNNDFVSVTITNGEAVIRVSPLFTLDNTATMTLADREIIQSLINLGSNDFKLTAIPPTSVETSQLPFTFDARVNYYLDDDVADGYIVKDYSQGRASMFPVYEGQSLSNITTYIAFPDNSTIPVAYHGQTGIQPSELDVAKVIEWSIEEYPGATELPSAGETVTLVGKLQDYSYTDFGYVTNEDNIYLKIKVTTLVDTSPTPGPSTSPEPTETPDPSVTPDPDATPTPEPSPTPITGEAIKITTKVNEASEVELNSKTFEYDKKKVGYLPADVQQQLYTIENIGTENISGLTLRISDFVEADNSTGVNSSPTSYVNSIPLYVNVLNVGDTTQFEIRTKCGLPAGTYEARVSVGSSKNAELAYFNISFTVTENDVYKVTVDNGDATQQAIGYGYLMDSDGSRIRSNTYEKDEIVPVYVEVLDAGYKFKEWTSVDVTFANAAQKSTSFTMPAQDVTVKPTFEETNDVWVRLADLRDYNENATTPNQLRNAAPPYIVTTFSETTYDYRTMVDGNVEKNFVEFDLKDRLLGETPPITVTMTLDGNSINVTNTGQQGTNANTTTFKSDLFNLKEGLNVVTITTEYTDPDGTVFTKTYTLTILRKAAVDVKMQPGNSPYGLIESSDNIPEADKPTAKANFSANHTYDPAYTPNKAVKTHDTKYYTDAWSGANYDEDPYALFVYNDTPFVDPGFKDLKDMDGNAVDPDTVKRTIEIKELAGSITSISELQTVTTSTVTVADTGESCLINELTTRHIRPGAYTLKYTFTDSDGSTAEFSRSLIVLTRKGDVNLDYATDSTDADMIYQRMSNDYYTDILMNTTDEWAKIYAYRIGDVTEDRNVNSIDANADFISLTQYYEELPRTETDTMQTFDPTTAVRNPVATLPPDKATLTLDYLGTASTPLDKAKTPDLTENSVYNPDIMGRGIVWFGIGIKNTENLEYFLDGLYSMDFAIDYDPAIFAPCDEKVRIDGDTDFDLVSTINKFNFNSSVTTSDVAYWKNAELYTQSLETDLNIDTTGTYKTEFVTIKSTNGTDLRLSNFTQPVDTDTIYLLRIPMRLIAYPPDGYTGKAITLNLTEHTFVMGATSDGVTASASWEGAIDKTTEVNNAENHFDGVEIVDIFGTDGKYNITGTLKAWNPIQPVKVEVYKSDAAANASPAYTFLSSDVDALNQPLYGTFTQTTNKGEIQWDFSLPVSNLFSYRMVITKLSHLDYPEITVDKDSTQNDKFEITDTIELIVGDINDDGVIKLPDRAELMRFFNRQKPWALDKSRFEAADLNGDEAVNLFDLNLLKQNYEKAYSVPTPAPTPDSSGGGGGGS